jgi:hypothetical protein
MSIWNLRLRRPKHSGATTRHGYRCNTPRKSCRVPVAIDEKHGAPVQRRGQYESIRALATLVPAAEVGKIGMAAPCSVACAITRPGGGGLSDRGPVPSASRTAGGDDSLKHLPVQRSLTRLAPLTL